MFSKATSGCKHTRSILKMIVFFLYNSVFSRVGKSKVNCVISEFFERRKKGENSGGTIGCIS